MPDLSFRVEMAGDVPVVVTPSDIDITNAAAFRTALLERPDAGGPSWST